PFSVDLPGGAGTTRLRLISDSVLEGSPGDADRFDIRDFCDWLEPWLELRREAWSSSVVSATPGSYPTLVGWTVDGAVGRDWKVGTLWDPTTRPYPSFHRVWILPGFPLALKRTLTVPRSGTGRWIVRVHRAGSSAAACRLDAFVSQRPIAKLPLPAIIPGE